MDNENIDGEQLVPPSLRSPANRSNSSPDIAAFSAKGNRQQWTWLGSESPLMGYKTEAEWILERLGATLEREMEDSRRKLLGKSSKEMKKPPVSLAQLIRDGQIKPRKGSGSGSGRSSPAASAIGV